MPSLTVAVCTFNRQDYLQKCLNSLAQQEGAPKYEVIVVDNNSTDDTAALVKSRLSTEGHLKYVFEPVQGLARARNAALKEMNSSIIAFTDDDATVPRNWVAKYVEAFAKQPDTVAVLGGEIDPVFEIDRPEWLSDELLRPLSAHLGWSETPRLLEPHEWLCEVNSAYRADPLRRYGGFPEALGRQGDNLLSGENYVNSAMRKDGFQEYFDPTIRVKHFVPASRLTREWFRRRYFWQGVTGAKLPSVSKALYGQHLDTWRQVNVPMSAADWVAMLSDDDEANFEQNCAKIYELGYLLGCANVVMGR